jgi:hypothetical protein
MKTNLTVLKSIKFTNHAQRCLYAAMLLQAATIDSPAVQIQTARATIPGKAAVIGQTAKPARPASVAIPANANTSGYGFGELFLNSPAYPIGTAIPAFPAKPASAAVIGVSAVAPLPAIQSISSPAVTKIPGYESAIAISKFNDSITIEAFLPIAQSPLLLGSSKESFKEITSPNLVCPAWIGLVASTVDDTFSTTAYTPQTLEEYLHFWAKETVNASTSGSVSYETKVFNGVAEKCKKISLIMSAESGYNQDIPEFSKISYYTTPQGGGGNFTMPLISN